LVASILTPTKIVMISWRFWINIYIYIYIYARTSPCVKRAFISSLLACMLRIINITLTYALKGWSDLAHKREELYLFAVSLANELYYDL
jgi:hypothetical protein